MSGNRCFWILLQPRDYLSSFLLYAMLALAIIGVIMGNPSLDTMPVLNKVGNTTPVFPVLFTTIACGAISGFHSLVSSGTTSKQLDKETDAKSTSLKPNGMRNSMSVAALA